MRAGAPEVCAKIGARLAFGREDDSAEPWPAGAGGIEARLDIIHRVVPPILEMRGISKAFPGVRALDGVSLSVQAGEVHVLLGQNGAGKSTLIKVLCGAQRPDAGEVLVDGRPVRIDSPADARRLGIAVIFQEFSLVPYLSIAQNIFLGREYRCRVPGTIDRRRMHVEAARLLGMLGVELDTRTLVHTLGVAQHRHRVANGEDFLKAM